MAILRYQDEHQQYREREFKRTIHIGSDRQMMQGLAGELVVLPAELGVAPHHATVVFSKTQYYGLFVLVDVAGQPLRVNGRQVISIQILKHNDLIQPGRANLMFYELYITRLAAKDDEKHCVLCTDTLSAGREVIFCPHCGLPYCRPCGLTTAEHCGNASCGYPIQQRVMDTISPWATIERNLAYTSDMVLHNVRCDANNRFDVVPFQAGDHVITCPTPSCRYNFHLMCWLSLEECTNPKCRFKIHAWLDRVFSTRTEMTAEGDRPDVL